MGAAVSVMLKTFDLLVLISFPTNYIGRTRLQCAPQIWLKLDPICVLNISRNTTLLIKAFRSWCHDLSGEDFVLAYLSIICTSLTLL